MKLAARYVLYSQILLALSLVVCTVIYPHFLFSGNEGGVSNYAVHSATIVPVTIGFLGCATLLVAAARQLNADKYATKLAPWLKANATGYVLVLVSTYPYKTNDYFDAAHIYISLAFGILLTATTIWLIRRCRLDRLNLLAIIVLIIGYVLGFATLLGTVHLLFVSQLLTGTAYGMTLIHVLTLSAAHQARLS